MYGLPVGFDTGIFVGKALEQVCIGASNLGLNFDGNLSIMITSSIAFITAREATQRFEDFTLAAAAVVGILQEKVIRAYAIAPGTLHLDFSNGAALEIFDDSEQFESYVIRCGVGGPEIVV